MELSFGKTLLGTSLLDSLSAQSPFFSLPQQPLLAPFLKGPLAAEFQVITVKELAAHYRC